jgi:2-phospho-L-lactate guanylyltransferase
VPLLDTAAVLIPVKSFTMAKVRLAGVLDDAQRAALARAMAERVVEAAAPLPVWCVCDDPAVRDWAGSVPASVDMGLG